MPILARIPPSVLLGIALAGPAAADTWVLEPSISLDQRFDDNYRLETELEREVSATRLVGDLGLSRETRTSSFTGGARVDALLTSGDYEADELDSNQVLFIDSSFRDELTTWGIDLSFKQDTPSRDISADLSSDASEATDNGVVTQRSNVARRRLVVAPGVTRDLTRRASVDATLTFTAVEHDLPSVSDAVYARYASLYNAQNAPTFNRDDVVPEAEDGSALRPGEVSIDTPGIGVFTPTGELDDYREAKLQLGYRYALSPISTASAIVAYSDYVADVVPDTQATVPFEDLEPDPDESDIRRFPRGRDSRSTTSSFRLGYERNLTPTLKGGVQAGLYHNTTDDTDTFREGERRDPVNATIVDPETGQTRQMTAAEYLERLETSENGWLANVTLAKDAGLTRYALRFGVDVQPSSIGTQVETQELIGDVYRTLTPLLDFSFRVRAYEPDRLGANPDDRFARRFLSLEPKLVWRFSRAWTAAASYRYRRQKSRVETESGESNAVLFSLKYTPPSAIRDAVNAGG